ncbi:hypothetical protein ASD62_07290 [Phycicoccus sp. Root563]|uniref:hypothetical protein n=1 Tax=unclassified Phycicoccus TaxID=2637926 RepID=UPI000702B658|nr:MULTISPECIES: hypothetical protein [unclassified Phycicoccus]KQU70847.1 hypothetical protein ASC58_03510 [Phycicoccus sp. Root101]KQZ89137.1 hypothetical protein ASD62_07290 [Phycicoccus sp. Root563]
MPSTKRGTVLSEHRPPSRTRRLVTRVVLLLFVAGLVGAGWIGLRGTLHNLGGPRCQATALGTSVDFDPSQTAYAATIVAIAEKRGLPARAGTIAIATAIQESKLRNLTYGDRDSVGLFQQRPSQGWGTEKQILDPVYATNKFYDALVKVDGYEQMRITEIAQKVQRSAYPEAYADHEQEGRLMASTLSGHSPGGLGCRLDDSTGGRPADLRAALSKELGVKGSVKGSVLTVKAGSERQAWSTGSFAVAKAAQYGATKVRVGSKEWTRTRDTDGWTWKSVKGGAGTTVTVTFPTTS